MTIPQTIYVGDTFQVELILATTVTAVEVLLRGADSYDLIAELDESGYWTTNTDTSTWTAGTYAVLIRKIDNGITSTVRNGNVEVVDTSSITTALSTAESIIQKIDAVLEGRATKDVASYSINGRSLSKTSIPDLLSLRKFYADKVSKENRKRSGRGQITMIKAVL